jgi:hypothetical protein
MKLFMLAILTLLWVNVIAYAWGDGEHHRGHNDDDDDNRDPQSRDAVPVRVRTFPGTPFPPSPRTNQPDDNEEGPSTPIGQSSGPINPSSPPINVNLTGGNDNTDISLAKRQECGGKGIVFDTSTVFSSNTDVGVLGSPAEPSGARAGNVIFSTSNWLAAISIDGGATFNDIDPSVYSGPANPATDNGFCCDQVVQYLPSIDRFVWLIQYVQNNAGINRLRLITFHPGDVDRNKIKSWIYLDITSANLNVNSWLDYGELAVGDNQLYLSATVIGTGLVVLRIPIAALNVVGSLTYSYTNPSDGAVAASSRLSQNPGNTVFWAGHLSDGTSMRIFRFPESGGQYFWTRIGINGWPTDTTGFFSACPNDATATWTFGNLANAIIGATRRFSTEVWFAWNAPSGGGFPHPHVQLVQISVANWPSLSLIRQWQVWNPDFGFSYPALYTNAECGDVALAIAFGGGGTNPSGAVGVMNSDGVLTQTVYYPELSGTCEFRFGDYFAVRSANVTGYEAFVYAIQPAPFGSVERRPRFVAFGRG